MALIFHFIPPFISIECWSNINLKNIKNTEKSTAVKAEFDIHSLSLHITTKVLHILGNVFLSASYSVCTLITIFVCCCYLDFVSLESPPHIPKWAPLHSSALCQCWQPVLHCESAWGLRPGPVPRSGHWLTLSSLSSLAPHRLLTAARHSPWLTLPPLHMTLSELDEQSTHNTHTPPSASRL